MTEDLVAPPAPYPASQYPAAQTAYAPAGYAPAAPGVVCRVCGAWPAIRGKARGHRGMIVLMQSRSISGPFCRDCGIAAVRKMSGDTFWQGWWGFFSFIATPFALLLNFILWVRLERLDPPVRYPGMGTPLSPGMPLYRHPGLIVPIAIIFAIGLLIGGALFGG